MAAYWKQRFRLMAVRGALGAAGFVFVLGAVLFLFLAAYHWLSGQIGSIAAASSIAATLLVLGLVSLLLASRRMRETADLVARPEDSAGTPTTRIGLRDIASAAASPLRNPMVQTAGVALVAGILLGRRRKRR